MPRPITNDMVRQYRQEQAEQHPEHDQPSGGDVSYTPQFSPDEVASIERERGDVRERLTSIS